jgi:hypothetical protein
MNVDIISHIEEGEEIGGVQSMVVRKYVEEGRKINRRLEVIAEWE